MKFRFILMVFILILLVFGAFSRSLAASDKPASLPEQPDYVYGQVRLNGSLVPVGTGVSAWCGGVMVDENTTVEDAWYDLEIYADDPETPEKDGCVSGEVVMFTIDYFDADQTKPWTSGGNTLLDLSAEGFDIFLPLIIK